MKTLQDIIIALILFSTVATGIGVFVSSIAGTYGTADLDLDFLDAAENMSDEVEGMYGNVSSAASEDISIYGVATDMFSKGWQTIKLTFRSVTMIGTLANEIGEALRIPDFIVTGAISIFTVVFVFAVLYIIFKVW